MKILAVIATQAERDQHRQLRALCEIAQQDRPGWTLCKWLLSSHFLTTPHR